MEEIPLRRSSAPGQASTQSSLRNCLYATPASTAQNGSKSLRRTSKLKKDISDPPRPPALNRVKGTISMETPKQTRTDMSWLQDASPMDEAPRTPRSSRSETPESKSTSRVKPSSALLQGLLKEQRATRGARASELEELEDSAQRKPDWCQIQSRFQPRSRSHSQSQSLSQEEPGSEKQQSTKMSSSGVIRQPRDMGVRETDQYISKISKQNFDLKLEIFHRVQQLCALEKKLERMQELEEELERMHALEDEVQELRAAEEDNQRLRDSNQQLRREIDKRDQAVTEAVELICQLEARVEELETGLGHSRPSTPRPTFYESSDDATPTNASLVDIPERTSSRRAVRQLEHRQVSAGSRDLQRAPSFLLEESNSTAVLRSLYIGTEDEPQTGITRMTKSESMNSMAETVEPHSPRLSALSECSELNINGSPVEVEFDRIDIPVKKGNSAEAAIQSPTTLSISDQSVVRLDRWLPPDGDNASKMDVSSRKLKPSWNLLKEAEKPSPSSSFNSSSRRSKTESIFESSQLPQTPDTMTTEYPAWANRSFDRTIADKSQADLKRYLTRARSADELTARRSSLGSEPRQSLDMNLSDATFPRASLDEKDEDPAIFPLNSIQSGYGYSSNQDLVQEGFLKLLARMDRDYYPPIHSPPRRVLRDRPASPAFASPSLTPEDWVEAARPDTWNRTGPPVKSHLVRARAPSQRSSLNRRHSIDSAVREPNLPIIQTVNLRSLENDSNASRPPGTTEPEPHSRRRISILPSLFSRSTTTRRFQPTPTPELVETDDGAPCPVIPKTRNQIPKASRPNSLHVDSLAASGPTYAEGNMPRSATDANLSSSLAPSATSRTPNSGGGKDMHKRRGSLGIFGWMKGAGKKSDAPTTSSPSTPTDGELPTTPRMVTSSGITSVRASSRLTAHDNVALNTESTKPAGAVTEDLATRSRYPSRTDDPADEQGRRPRYTDRRGRRP
ncbi:hypothetical protein BJX61DRAFT_494682 [Aspergillus egyptiacus]|nr:hypothetical protein BJX61DRAFT_494682 [Aspergillus egyptiacus]